MIKQMLQKSFILFLIAFLFLLLSFFINRALMIRVFLLLTSLVLFTYFFYKMGKYKKKSVPFVFFFLFLLSILGDAIFSYTLKRIPIYSYNITTTANTRIYNAIGIKVWQCDKEDYQHFVVSPFYENGYLCDATHLEAMDTNAFFKTIVENFLDYQDTTIKLRGRISKKGALNYIEMAPYREEEGQIVFDSDILLSVFFKKEEASLLTLKEGDEITLIGLIKNRELSKAGYIIYLNEAELVLEEGMYVK